MTVFCIVTVTESGVKLHAIIFFAHGMIWAGDDVEPGHRRIFIFRHPVFEARLRTEIPKGVLDHTCRIAVVKPSEMEIPRNGFKHHAANPDEEAADKTHFSGEYANQMCYNDKIVKMFDGEDILDSLILEGGIGF